MCFQVEMKGKGKLLTFWLVREDPPDHPEDEYNEGGSVFTEDETNISHWEIEATPDADSHTETEGEEKFWRECEMLEESEETKNIQKLNLDFCKESDKHDVDFEGKDQTEKSFNRNESHTIASSIESEECSDKAQIISDDCAGGKSQVTNDQATDDECTTL